MRSRPVIPFVVLVFVLLAAASWFLFRPAAIDRSRVYRIGYGNDAPMHYRGPDGKPAGLAVELVQAAARRANLQLQWIPGDNLDPKTMDMWVLLTILPERLKTTHFSDPYLQIESCLVVRDDSPYQRMEDLKSARIACNRMPISQRALAEALPGARQQPVASTDEAIAALDKGQVDAAFIDEYVIVSESLQGKSHVPFRILPNRTPKRYLAIGATPECGAVADELRKAMQSMPEDMTYPLSHWTFYASPITDTIGELAIARRRLQWLWIGLLSLSIVTATTVGLAIHSRIQSAKLRRTEMFLSETSDRVPGIVFQYRLRPDGTACFPYASEAIRQILHVSPDSIREDAGPMYALVHREDREAFDASIRLSALQLTPWVFEYRVASEDGTVRWLAGSAVPHREGNGGTLWHGVITETTEQRRWQMQSQRSQRLESIGTLASGIAHDFNNILTPISMSVDLLQSEVTTEEARGILAIMKEAAQHGANTVRQLLTIARGADVEKGPIQLRYLSKEISDLIKKTFPKNIQIYTDFDPDTPLVRANPSQLHQVFMNLCVNARDAMPDGGVLFIKVLNETLGPAEVSRSPKARPIAYVVISISDSGTGIPPEVIDRIFDPFFTTKAQGKGTGLGLATVLGIVEDHGGFVLAESVLGKGTTFKAYLPAIEATEPAVIAADRGAAPRGSGELVLVVDDELAILRVAGDILVRAGYAVVTASNSSEALALFLKNRGRVKAIVTDIMMPFGDGRALIPVLRQQDPSLRIVAMSGISSKSFQGETLSKGADVFLAKPFQAAELLRALAELPGR